MQLNRNSCSVGLQLVRKTNSAKQFQELTRNVEVNDFIASNIDRINTVVLCVICVR